MLLFVQLALLNQLMDALRTLAAGFGVLLGRFLVVRAWLRALRRPFRDRFPSVSTHRESVGDGLAPCSTHIHHRCVLVELLLLFLCRCENRRLACLEHLYSPMVLDRIPSTLR